MEIEAFAPAKVILLGEHFVVFGAGGIACAIEPYNRVEIRLEKEGRAGLEYNSTLSDCSLVLKASECMKENLGMHPISAVYCHLLSQHPKLREYHVKVNVKRCWPIKGVGSSSSLSGAVALGIRRLMGEGEIGSEKIFEDVQMGDRAAHGNPSGIDAAAISMGGAIIFRKMFDGQMAQIKRIGFSIPDKFAFAIVDTKKLGGKKADTKKQVERFAHHFGVSKKPLEMMEGEREKIISGYEEIARTALDALAKSDMNLLGKCLMQNHALLKEAGVSSPSIEKAIKICMENGALGAKMSGAGGEGGAVIAIFKKEKMENAKKEIEKEGFEMHEFKIALKGVHTL